jgi:hypothetical protein
VENASFFMGAKLRGQRLMVLARVLREIFVSKRE